MTRKIAYLGEGTVKKRQVYFTVKGKDGKIKRVSFIARR